MKACKILIYMATALLLTASCADRNEPKSRYYGESYNFIVMADSMMLLRFLPSEASLYQDTLFVYEGERVAVVDILSSDSLEITADTAWIQLLKDDTTFGWVEEMSMRKHVVPDDPISQGIAIFSDSHLPVFLIAIAAGVVIYLLRRRNRRIPFVHFNDIGSAYPALLCVIISLTATLYASIQMFAGEEWQEYYYHPTLNPVAEHGLVCWFLSAVWVIIIMAVASVSEVMKLLKPTHALLYLCGLFAVCAADYIVFSQLTPFYVGYPLLVLYVCFAIRKIVSRQSGV